MSNSLPPISTLVLLGRNAADLDALDDWVAVRIGGAADTIYVLAEVDREPTEEDREALDLVVTTVLADTHEGQYATGRFASDPRPAFEPPGVEYVRCWPPAA